MENDFLAKSGIRMVMNAGDARVLLRESLDRAKNNEFDRARSGLAEANEKLREGHEVQTLVLQKECEGEPQGYNVLFSHGMDTLMTVKSEYELAEKLVDILEVIDARLKKLEG